MTGPTPETRLGGITDVGDAGRLVECHQISRQLRFQHLVRHYLSQILYGCKSAHCTTPTCLSCNKRLVTKPHRRPTQLTARSLAYYLASQDHPHHGLCPHQLKVDPSTLEIEGADGVNIHQAHDGSGQICDVFPRASLFTSHPIASEANATADDNGEIGKQGDTARLADAIAKRRQVKKDPKSLGQNLYDTATMIFSYSKRLPTPVSVFTSLRSPPVPIQQSIAQVTRTEPFATPGAKRPRVSSHTAFTRQPNRHATPPAVNANRTSSEIAAQPSHRNRRRSSRSNGGHGTSEVLRNGHHVHRIRHVPALAHKSYFSRKPLYPSSLDGALDGTQIAKPKMRAHARAINPVPMSERTSPPTPSAGPGCNRSKSPEPVTIPVASHLTCDVMDHLKEDVYHRSEQSSDFNFVVDYDTNRKFQSATPFVNRSLFFTLSDPETLLKSFRDELNKDFANSPLPHLDSYRLANAFRDWNQRNGALVFDSLCISIEALFRPPPELNTQKSPRLKPSRKGATSHSSQEQASPDLLQNSTGRYLSDEEAAHIIMICIHALTSLVPNGWPHAWVQVRKFRGWGVVVPDAPPQTDFTDGFAHPWLSIVDELEYEPAVRLATRLLRGIGARMCFEEVLSKLQVQQSDDYAGKAGAEVEHSTAPGALANTLVRHLEEVERNTIARKTKMKVVQDTSDDPGWTVTATFMEWLRTIIVKQWDGKAVIHKWSDVGAAFSLLSRFYSKRCTLNLRPQMFNIPYLNERIDTVQTPIDFLSFQYCPNTIHILEFPFLFPQEYLVGYFRAINFATMLTQFDHSTRTANLQSRLDTLFSDQYYQMIRDQLKASLSDYLVMQVSRENVLKETLDQLWGQEKRMLLKPLKVRLGTLEGEVGFDQGGVTCEFFRLVLSEAFRPDNGMFTVDSETRMIWFQPASFEPDWKFQMLGVLFSLAVYNGVTLPVTFPLVFYTHLLIQDPCSYSKSLTTDSIRDGWPTLAKSFDELLAYDGEVADVYMRDYIFSFEAFGHKVDVDMQAFEGLKRWPARNGPPHPDRFENASAWRASLKRPALSDPAWLRPMASKREAGDDIDAEVEAPAVTNANRDSFVKDYIHWLVHRSVERQVSAFVAGFYTCLNRRSLTLFTPTTLRDLVEGNPVLPVSLLRKATRYEGTYHAEHPAIIDFWSIVESYSQEDVRKLLEFVTASDRVPIIGFERMSFVIERNGGDTDLLPTSSTCFGKLYLPEYADKEKMRGKLDLALMNCEGFGNA